MTDRSNLIPLFIPAILSLSGLLTIVSPNLLFSDVLFRKQVIFFIIALIVVVVIANSDISFIQSSPFLTVLYASSILALIGLLLFGPIINGAKSWIIVGGISIQVIDFVKIVLILVFAKYLAHRHKLINHIKTFAISLFLALPIFLLTLLQSDLGSSITVLGVWLGIVFVSGIDKKYIFGLIITMILSVFFMWQFVLADYQRDRIISFISPDTKLQTSGYSSYQSKIAIGSGGFLGKGVTEGTQSKLKFLPLYESDFIFSAFAEEWGFVGAGFLISSFFLFFSYLFYLAKTAETNFEGLFIVGVIASLFSHFFIHIFANIGLAPVTGITLPFMSYGGSHLLAEAIMLGIVFNFVLKRN